MITDEHEPFQLKHSSDHKTILQGSILSYF